MGTLRRLTAWAGALIAAFVVLWASAWPVKASQGGQLDADKLECQSCILIDNHTGDVLFEKDADAKRYPASTTKLMTALLALELTSPLDMVTADKACLDISADSTKIALQPGEVLSMEELLYGLLVSSGNDCANAIAVYVAGSVPAFIDMMNQRAKELGMDGTHYVNAHGLHDDEHYTTARDMAKLAQQLQQFELFCTIVKTAKHTIPATNLSAARTLITTNHLLRGTEGNRYYYEPCTGIKTGYTTPAGGCLVASAQKDGMDLLAVLLKDVQATKWATATTLFEYGFNNYRTINIMEEITRRPVTVQVPNAANDDLLGGLLQLEFRAQSSAYLTDRTDIIQNLVDNLDSIELACTPDLSDIRAPIEEGQKVADFKALLDGQELLSGSLVATRSVGEKKGILLPMLDFEQKLTVPLWPFSPLQWVAIMVVVCIVALMIWRLIYVAHRKRRRRAMQAKRMQVRSNVNPVIDARRKRPANRRK
nr:D-alanyl-D-alanine carboxypeptidase [bacterium]